MTWGLCWWPTDAGILKESTLTTPMIAPGQHPLRHHDRSYHRGPLYQTEAGTHKPAETALEWTGAIRTQAPLGVSTSGLPLQALHLSRGEAEGPATRGWAVERVLSAPHAEMRWTEWKFIVPMCVCRSGKPRERYVTCLRFQDLSDPLNVDLPDTCQEHVVGPGIDEDGGESSSSLPETLRGELAEKEGCTSQGRRWITVKRATFHQARETLVAYHEHLIAYAEVLRDTPAAPWVTSEAAEQVYMRATYAGCLVGESVSSTPAGCD